MGYSVSADLIPSNGPHKGFYPDGKVWVETNYANGKKNGPFKIYYENGQVDTEGTYNDGLIEGSVKKYYESGQIMTDGNFIHGKLEGELKAYYENGQISEDRMYKNNQLEGLFKSYYDDGAIRSVTNYQNQQADTTMYYRNGGVMNEIVRKNDECVSQKDYYENGKPKRIETMEGFLDHIQEYNEKGELTSDQKYKNINRMMGIKHQRRKIPERTGNLLQDMLNNNPFKEYKEYDR